MYYQFIVQRERGNTSSVGRTSEHGILKRGPFLRYVDFWYIIYYWQMGLGASVSFSPVWKSIRYRTWKIYSDTGSQIQLSFGIALCSSARKQVLAGQETKLRSFLLGALTRNALLASCFPAAATYICADTCCAMHASYACCFVVQYHRPCRLLICRCQQL